MNRMTSRQPSRAHGELEGALGPLETWKSRESGLNRRPVLYESTALPLSYRGGKEPRQLGGGDRFVKDHCGAGGASLRDPGRSETAHGHDRVLRIHPEVR